MKKFSNYIKKHEYKNLIVKKIEKIISKHNYINQYIEIFYSFEKSVFYDLPNYKNMNYLLLAQSRNESQFLNNLKDVYNSNLDDFRKITSENEFNQLIINYNKKISENKNLDRFLIYINSKEKTFLDKKDKIYAEFKSLNTKINENFIKSISDISSKKFVFLKNSQETVFKNMDLGDIVYCDISEMKQHEIKKLDEILSIIANFGVKFVLHHHVVDGLTPVMNGYTSYEVVENLHNSEKHCIIVYDY